MQSPLYPLINSLFSDWKALLDKTAQFDRAVSMLESRGILFNVVEEEDGYLCKVYSSPYCQEHDDRCCDFILRHGSYGSEDNLLEWWDYDQDPAGWLTAEEVADLCMARVLVTGRSK